MPKNLLIVESPAKANTLTKYLGSDYSVRASYGHVRELVPKQGSVNVDKNFEMKFQTIEKNEKHLSDILKAAEKCENIYLATDPDREGEAIAWHLVELMRQDKRIKNLDPKRVEFHEITKSAVLSALDHPRRVSEDLVDAQQARSALDFLLGFNLSPLLWKKIQRGLSAGRVQSPALRLVCDREKEIRAFQEREYWTIHLLSAKQGVAFEAALTRKDGKKLEQFDIPDQSAAQAIVDSIKSETATVSAVSKRKRSRRPSAPFTTSTMQQEAVRKLSMSTAKTMRTAQQLYEGIDVGSGSTGLITYMRTDSVNLAKEAVADIRSFIEQEMGAENLPDRPNVYKTKSKNAQEAHEAIRPTSIRNTPDKIRKYLNADQFKLYSMIWKRAVACQMADAKYDMTSADVEVDGLTFRATGQTLLFPGFLRVYIEDFDDDDSGSGFPTSAKSGDEPEGGNARLPELEEGETLPVNGARPDQHFTAPPPRYSEASLVKALEEFGIGRPSTYATIIQTLQRRNYAVLANKRFEPTETGETVNNFLTEHFPRYVDYNFTAGMEKELDDIANGKLGKLKVLNGFWGPFIQQVRAKEGLTRMEATGAKTLDEVCPMCNAHKLVEKYGKRGRFIACSGFPECKYTRNLNETREESLKNAAAETLEGKFCPKCGRPLAIKQGRFGKFIACTGYPECKHTESLVKPLDTGVECPECKKGALIERKSRYGTPFYSCSRYPDCKYALWNYPVKMACPSCGSPCMTLKFTKRRGLELLCPNKDCSTYMTYCGDGSDIGVPAEALAKIVPSESMDMLARPSDGTPAIGQPAKAPKRAAFGKGSGRSTRAKAGTKTKAASSLGAKTPAKAKAKPKASAKKPASGAKDEGKTGETE